MQYICLHISDISPENNEIVTALLSENGFESFVETEDGGFDAFVEQAFWTKSLSQKLARWKKKYAFSTTKTNVENRNWNADWEASFQPVVLEGYVAIRAKFHPAADNVRFDIVINPQMAFGTGHHETTQMMLEAMEHLDFKTHHKVLDYGCGTGILAIVAAKLGATHVEGVDNELPAYQDTLENAELNGVAPQLHAFYGTLDAIENTGFDVILANITRNIILQSLDTLCQKIKRGGYLLLSGFLREDEPMMRENLSKYGFNVLEKRSMGNWMCLTCSY
jgi:ribosomal protein L11 methyltransferase